MLLFINCCKTQQLNLFLGVCYADYNFAGEEDARG